MLPMLHYTVRNSGKKEALFCAVMSLLIILVSCGNKLPAGVLDINRMKGIVWDMVRAEEYTKGYLTGDSLVQMPALQIQQHQKVFAIHKTDAKTFFASYRYYQEHPVLQKQLFDSVQAVASRQGRRLANGKPF